MQYFETIIFSVVLAGVQSETAEDGKRTNGWTYAYVYENTYACMYMV